MIILLLVLWYLLIGFGVTLAFHKKLDQGMAPVVITIWPVSLWFFGMLFLYDRVVAMLEERG